MPRFVLLRHECPPGLGTPSHWDLMLENGPALATWRLLELPTSQSGSVYAIRLADHRLVYLDYEGPLSGGRGDVRRVDAGDFDGVQLSATQWQVRLRGTVLAGSAVLNLVSGDAWTFSLRHEPPAT